MSTRRLFMILGMALAASGYAFADEPERSRPPAQAPDWTDHNEHDPGQASVAEELQAIVVLCAKNSNSPEFNRAWVAYVRGHKLSGGKLESTIQNVVNEAAKLRRVTAQPGQPQRSRSSDWKNNTSRMMRDAAMNAVRNMKG